VDEAPSEESILAALKYVLALSSPDYRPSWFGIKTPEEEARFRTWATEVLVALSDRNVDLSAWTGEP